MVVEGDLRPAVARITVVPMGLADRMIRLLWAVGGEDVAARILRAHWRLL